VHFGVLIIHRISLNISTILITTDAKYHSQYEMAHRDFSQVGVVSKLKTQDLPINNQTLPIRSSITPTQQLSKPRICEFSRCKLNQKYLIAKLNNRISQATILSKQDREYERPCNLEQTEHAPYQIFTTKTI
jgi:hypothetical protein